MDANATQETELLTPRFGSDGKIGMRRAIKTTINGIFYSGGCRDWSYRRAQNCWKDHRRTKWLIRRPGKRHFEMIRFRREAHA